MIIKASAHGKENKFCACYLGLVYLVQHVWHSRIIFVIFMKEQSWAVVSSVPSLIKFFVLKKFIWGGQQKSASFFRICSIFFCSQKSRLHHLEVFSFFFFFLARSFIGQRKREKRRNKPSQKLIWIHIITALDSLWDKHLQTIFCALYGRTWRKKYVLIANFTLVSA